MSTVADRGTAGFQVESRDPFERQPAADPSLDLSACDREPIHVPGAVQPHGVLLALSESDRVIRQASANAADVLGRAVGDLLGRRVAEALGPVVGQAVDAALAVAGEVPNPLWLPVEVGGRRVVFDGVLHRTDGVAVLELENPRGGEDLAPVRDRLLDTHYRLIQQTLARLTRCRTVAEVADVVAEEVRAFTGFDRVMVYKFEEDGHGWVVAEDRAADVDAYLGLHFPASDVPRQARRLYELNWLRLIADADYEPAPIVPAENPATGRPLDLSKSVLRSVSPIHVRYLKNMGVGSSMSISLMRGERLWGLIACHHREAKFVSYAARTACVLFATVLSAQVVAVEQNRLADERARRRELLAALLRSVAERGSVTAGLFAEPERLLAFAGAGGAAASFSGEATLIGQTPPPERVEAILRHLDATNVPDLFATDSLPSRADDLRPEAATACGVLSLRFPSGDYLLFFRPEVVRTVRWAGDPRKPAEAPESPPPKEGTNPALTPRNSFAAWAETVRDRSAAWDPGELELAAEFRNALSVHILRRAESLAQLNRRLAAKNEEMSQFLYTVSHDLKSPLITCRGFIGLLREDLQAGRHDDLDDFARRIDDAAGHMGRLIEDLLELYRIGRNLRPPRAVPLRQAADDLRADFATRLAAAGATFETADDLPATVLADPTALKRVLDNLLGNALKYACSGPDRRLTLGGTESAEETRLYLRDRGPGVPASHREKVFQLFQRFAPADVEGSGLGLASVATVMRLHGGRAWVDDTPGGGATFWVAFPTAPHAWSSAAGPARGGSEEAT